MCRRMPGTLGFNIIWALMQETPTLLLANNKGSDQPVHPHSLISVFDRRMAKNGFAPPP